MKRLLFLFLFSLYLLTYAPDFHSSDGLAMFSTAESLARRGAWDIEQIRWMGLQQGTFGLDGNLYSRKGLGQPLLALPLTWLGVTLPGFGPTTVTLLFGSLLTALTAVLIFKFLRLMGYSQKVGLLAALVYGTGTMAWPYAKTFFSDTLAGTLLLATTLALLKFKLTGRYRFAALAGLALAWAVATRYAEGVFLPVFGVAFLIISAQQPAVQQPPISNRRFFIRHSSPILLPALIFAAPIAVVGLFLLIFNLARYGNPLSTGYLPQETFSAVWWQGILGQLVSPGRGLLLYNPILLVSFWGARSFWQRHRTEFLGAAAVILIHLLLYGKWFMWHGGFAWGARFMVATLPFWVILMAPALENLFPTTEKPIPQPVLRWRKAFFLLWGISVAAQIPGVAVDFDHWQNRLLETGLPLFAPETFFTPLYSPLLQTWQFITLPNLDVAWVTNGKILWGLLAALAANFGAATALLYFALPRAEKKTVVSRALLTLAATVAVLTTLLLLLTAHKTQPPDLQQAMAIVNQGPDIPLVYQQPEQATAIAELYAGHAPVLGLGALEPATVDKLTATATAVWWLPPFQNDVERYLLQTYGVARNETFGKQQLVLLARPDGDSRLVEIQFGAAITLERVHLSHALVPNRPFAVTLSWRADRVPAADYQVFIHLLDAGGNIVGQTDGQPVHWTRPTSTWQPGEQITDRHALWVRNLSPGTYTLIAGLYLPATGDRLSTAAGASFVQLGQFKVAP